MSVKQASYLSRFPNLVEGLPVYSSDGEKLGKVTRLFDDYFIIEKGLFFPKDFTLRYDDIQNIKDDSVYLTIRESELSGWRNESYAGWKQTEDINAGRLSAQPQDEYRERYRERFSEETKIPVVEEELQVQKTSRQAGEILVRKVVHTELRHLTVPVTKEEVRVERVPVSGREKTLSPEDTRFGEKTIKVPVMEEEVTVSKRPVVKEEVQVSKEKVTRHVDVEGEVRKEDVQIEGEDQIKRKKAG